MSWQPAHDPTPAEAPCPPEVETVIVPRTADVGGFKVRRVLPSRHRRMVGPFIFMDQMGPGEMVSGQGIDVLPHPHIGLSTVTYLFDGQITHRDSIGTEKVITPGSINLMTAGRGVAHSERSPLAARDQGGRMFGIQSWMALPRHLEEQPPAFLHQPKEALPRMEDAGVDLRLVAGAWRGVVSPVSMAHPGLYLDCLLQPGATIEFPPDTTERAVYPLDGAVEIAHQRFEAQQLLVLAEGVPVTITALERSRLLLFGGEPMDGPRYVWWNFVSSSQERIEQAKRDWKEHRFEHVFGEGDEYVPLP